MIIACSNCGRKIERTKHRALKGNCYCNAKCQMDYEYATGIRNRNTIVLKANQAVRDAPYKPRPQMMGENNPAKQIEARKKISESKKGSKNWMYGRFGKAHHNYKTGASTGRKLAWNRSIYQNWRKAVFAKDDYICQMCGDNTGGNLHAHHIKSWADCMEGRFDITNGITLCEPCHQNIHKKGENVHAECRCAEVT